MENNLKMKITQLFFALTLTSALSCFSFSVMAETESGDGDKKALLHLTWSVSC